jgi:hypothetical protein
MDTEISTVIMTTRQFVEQNETLPQSSGRHPQGYGQGASSATAKTENVHQTESLMEAVVERQNKIV